LRRWDIERERERERNQSMQSREYIHDAFHRLLHGLGMPAKDRVDN
jgi:hypothetical protein